MKDHEKPITLLTVVPTFVVRPWVLVGSNLITFCLYIAAIVALYQSFAGLWSAITGLPVEPPIIAFMGDYSKPAQNGYWAIVKLSILTSVLLNALFWIFLKANFGHWLFQIRYCREDGGPVTARHFLRKCLAALMLFLLIVLPGPILGFTLGPGSEPLSLAALGTGTIMTVYLTCFPDRSGRTWPFRFARVVPVYKSRLADFQAALDRDQAG